MKFFKTLSAFVLALALAAPQMLLADSDIKVEVINLGPCATINSISASAACNGTAGEFNVTVTFDLTLEGSASGTATATLNNGGGDNNSGAIADGTNTITISGVSTSDGGSSVTLVVNASGTNCNDPSAPTDMASYTAPTSCSSCASTLTISNADVMADATYLAGSNINTSTASPPIIMSGVDIIFDAPTHDLLAGFEVQAGATFETLLNGCAAVLTDDEGEENVEVVVVNELPVPVAIAPNPTNTEATIFYDLPEDTRVMITLVNMQGEHIKVLANETQMAGQHNVRVNASDMPTGTYFVVVRTDKHVITEQMSVFR